MCLEELMIDHRKALTGLSFQSLEHLGIDWREIVKSNPNVAAKFTEYINKKQEWVMVEMDYSQLELYVLASLSGDPSMVAAVNSGKDIHRINTENIYKISFDSIDKELTEATEAFKALSSTNNKNRLTAAEAGMEDFKTKRKCTKALSFSLTYGAGPSKIAGDLSMTIEEATKLINDFYGAYPKVKEWQNQSVINAIKNGYIETPFGRRRGTPTLHHNMDAYKAFVQEDKKAINTLYKNGEYWSLREAIKVCYNAPVQSYATDICSTAAIKVYDYLIKNKLPAHLFFWVHDSILSDMHRSIVLDTIPEIMRIMENDCKLESDLVNYRSSCSVGFNYEYMSEIKRQDAYDLTEEMLDKKLIESMDADKKKKFKLIIKSSGKVLDKNYTKSESQDKEEYFTKLVEKLGISGVSTPQDYFCYMNGCSKEEYEEAMEFSDADEGRE